MRVAILTLPLHINYGGIVQTYALQTIVKNLGHDVYVLKHQPILLPERYGVKIRYWIYLKRFLNKYLRHKDIDVFVDVKERERYSKKVYYSQDFITKYINKKEFDVQNIKDQDCFDCYIVGSDQVWRPIYAYPIEKYYLKFLENKDYIRRIAYAASFGSEEWEYTEQQTLECAKLARKFDMITVREDSGVDLCQKYLGVKVTHVLDPTMLLEKADYVSIVEKENIPASKGNLFVYMLDDSAQKQNYVQQVALKLNLKQFTIIPSNKELDQGEPYPGVPVWLRAFMDAQFVVTDSFHGCVFSIIFNKPFIALGNKGRGQARFDSLLRMFHLQNRLVDVGDLSMDCIIYPIDWSIVNAIRTKMKDFSIALLTNALE